MVPFPQGFHWSVNCLIYLSRDDILLFWKLFVGISTVLDLDGLSLHLWLGLNGRIISFCYSCDILYSISEFLCK